MSGGSTADSDSMYFNARAEMHSVIDCTVPTLVRYYWNNKSDDVALARLLYPRSLVIFTISNRSIQHSVEVLSCHAHVSWMSVSMCCNTAYICH